MSETKPTVRYAYNEPDYEGPVCERCHAIVDDDELHLTGVGAVAPYCSVACQELAAAEQEADDALMAELDAEFAASQAAEAAAD